MSYLEREILGCFLKDNSLVKETTIQEEQFQEESSKLLFRSMIQLSDEEKVIDRITLLSRNYEAIQHMGGPDFITKLESTGDVEHYDSYEQEFIEQYKLRETENIAKKWLGKEDKNSSDLLSDLNILDTTGALDTSDKNETLREMHNEPFYENVVDAGVPSGFEKLDALTGGFNNELSYIMGARPSMGKTATMLKFVLSAAENGAVPIVFSLEMSERSLLRRLIATVGKINLFLTRNPHRLSEHKKDSWKKAVNELYTLDFEIHDKPMQTIQFIRSKVRQAQKRYEGKQIIVFIDYLTLIHNAGKFHSDHSMVSDVSARLKAIAKEYKCPVITLAQLSRGVEQRNDKRPMLSDLRESGSIEQDADMVMFLYRDSYYHPENDTDNMEIIIAKHRDGPTGSVEVHYNKATGRMEDLYDRTSSF